MQNGFVESFNGRLRDECLQVSWFTSIVGARRQIEAWRVDYNKARPPFCFGQPRAGPVRGAVDRMEPVKLMPDSEL
jgi:transposase InsO family protein